MTVTAPVVFLDCETTSLRHDRRAWEVAAIVRRSGQPVHEQTWLIDANDLDLGNADLASLRFGGFYDRHPQANRSGRYTLPPAEFDVLIEVEALTRGAVIHGSNPSFDMETLGARMRAHGICPSWHYHPVDVPTLAYGWLLGRGVDGLLPDAKSDAISKACGVDPEPFGRHTALGDCRWIAALHRKVTGGGR